jgi:hypothetical protein
MCVQALEKVYKNTERIELKFHAIKRNIKDIDKCWHLLNYLLNNNVQVRTYTIYKPFYIFDSFVTLCQDEILESLDIETGDLGFIQCRRNFLWFYALYNSGPEFLKDLIEKYQDFVYIKDNNSLGYLINTIKNTAKDPLNFFTDIGDYLIKNRELILSSIKNPGVSGDNEELEWMNELSWIDLNLSCTRQLLKIWEGTGQETMDIYHDNLISLEQKSGFFKFAQKSRDISIKGFNFVDSKDFVAIQIADIIAGCFNYSYEKKESKNIGRFDKIVKLESIDKIKKLIPDYWHIHLLPDINCMTSLQRKIIGKFKLNDKMLDRFCYEVFSS